MNPKLRQYATYSWLSTGAVTAVLKDGPGTLHGFFVGANANGNIPTINNNTFFLYDNSATATGTLITAQPALLFDDTGSKTFRAAVQFDLDFTQGLSLKLNSGNGGSVTVVFS